MNYLKKTDWLVFRKLGIIAALILFGSQGLTDVETDKIIIIERDSLGNPKASVVAKEKLTENLSTALSVTEDSMMSALEMSEVKVPPQSLQIRTIGVGVGLTGQLGLGPLVNITLSPRIRLIFTNSTNPSYPD